MKRLRWVTVATALAVALAGCGGPVVPTLQVGECVESLTETMVEKFPVIQCDKPHHWEAYATLEMDDAPEAPAEEEIAAQAEKFCVAEFKTFTGITLDESYLEVRYLFPSADSWKLNDRTILCLAGNDDDQKTGSLKGSKPYRR